MSERSLVRSVRAFPSYREPRPYGHVAEKGGALLVAWKDRATGEWQDRTILVSSARAAQAFRALDAGRRVV